MEKTAVGEVMISHEEILKRAAEIGAQITSDYEGQGVTLVGILRGAVPGWQM